MTALELKRLEVELLRVVAAKGELEFRIEERLEDVARMREHIKVQEAREVELKHQIAEEKRLKG